ncbi:hypothetical protein LX15_002324 [Streptoalloteichus tenebrarius]|uniref:Uncharacterized protein n=1 Tax=Streptoalloteichus tenebrarius (strain ATCC 17920 / DSM 40477 / JCM 4838 / CBS 697.72 / NBRC 16177 / NCIMB 11028 / NRRL B-12390 / A12253. 1 / ISP 5477) TaxID=1933 RepID=A0ABT1HSX4_STRSD|nr:hypothetical protein [Streptoalloteichus tenebrarius]MCP2258626.1 hypothetical protein [Streptoalloteichus tenebrarius]BFF04001.1 hypothetical protein GCM10020241_56760 [Streptoalloteichus tenebrarius]
MVSTLVVWAYAAPGAVLASPGSRSRVADVETGIGLGRVIVMVMAALSFTTEHRYGTLRVSYLATPRR